MRQAWHAMIHRCTDESNPGYAHYGGRGITVCKRWLASFDTFLADMGPRPPGWTLERSDNNAGYSPKNCRWASRHDQARNRRSNILLTWCGKTQCLTDWAKELQIGYATLVWRYKHGWSVNDIFTRSFVGRPITYKGKTQTLKAWAQELQISCKTLRQRRWLGWSIERTLSTPLNVLYRPR